MASLGLAPSQEPSPSPQHGSISNGSSNLDLLLDNFSEATAKSMVLAEAATTAEAQAAQAAEDAAAAYLAAAAAVGTPDFDILRDVAEAAERLLDSLTLTASQASQEYMDASNNSMHASSAAFDAAIHDEEDDADYNNMHPCGHQGPHDDADDGEGCSGNEDQDVESHDHSEQPNADST